MAYRGTCSGISCVPMFLHTLLCFSLTCWLAKCLTQSLWAFSLVENAAFSILLKEGFLSSPSVDPTLRKTRHVLFSEARSGSLLKNLHNVSTRSCFEPIFRRASPDLLYGMRYRRLGNTDLIVSEVALGTEHMGSEPLIDDEDALLQLEMAFKEYGINFLDTAEYDPVPLDAHTWGRGHSLILRKFLKSIDRDKVVISGRICSSNLGKDPKGWLLKWIRKDGKPPIFSKADVEEAVDGLLSRLGIDYIDLLLLDRPDRYVARSELGEDTYCWGLEKENATSIEEQVIVLNSLIEKGKVRYLGVGNETPWGIFQWNQVAKKIGAPKAAICSTQNMYSVLHRNELESSGLPEMMHRTNIPLIAYGSLAGGILTGKYLDPERFNPLGPDKRLGQDEWDNFLPTYTGNMPEDWGFLSYGPLTGKCNKYPYFYSTHRSVWCQWKVAELLKIARSYGMTLSQLALSWVYTRPFVASTIIGPRTTGQLRQSIAALNYPVTKELEADIHELFLRYRAPTMGGPQLMTALEEERPAPQHEFMRYGRGPIWSGGTYWPNFPLPIYPKQLEYTEKHEDLKEILRITGAFDDPTDDNWDNFRLWKERSDEGLPGEFFAVKESILCGWDKKKFWNFNWHKMTQEEVKDQDTTSFHFFWKGGKVYRGATTEKIMDFYKNRTAIFELLAKKAELFEDEAKYEEQLGPFKENVLNPLDVDLIDKKLREIHGIDILDKKFIMKIFDSRQKLTLAEKRTRPFWYTPAGFPDMLQDHKLPGDFL